MSPLPPRDLVVFSHPNHELAVFGLLQRRRPALLYLTDGGGPERVAQTQEGLRSIGLADHATFLDHQEARFYEALLDRDLPFFESVAEQIAATIDRVQPERILCDAVEYYNPVHDLSLPLVMRALAAPGRTAQSDVAVFEIPLIRQIASFDRERFAVQRPMASRGASQVLVTLNRQEVTAKMTARDEVYTLLTAQLGSVIVDLPEDHLATETLLPALSPIGRAADGVLRYERRAELLRREGAIERSITYADHFLPIAQSLAGDHQLAGHAAFDARPVS